MFLLQVKTVGNRRRFLSRVIPALVAAPAVGAVTNNDRPSADVMWLSSFIPRGATNVIFTEVHPDFNVIFIRKVTKDY